MLLPILERNQLVDAVVLHFYPQIRQWNQQRNGLDFNLELESTMLNEEYKEFLTAVELVDKFDAVCDYAFVLAGTIAKWMEHADDSDEVVEFIDRHSGHFVDMYILFTKYIIQHYHVGKLKDVAQLVINGMEVVTRKNFEKGFELNEAGKVKKPENFVGPEEELQTLLNRFADEE